MQLSLVNKKTVDVIFLCFLAIIKFASMSLSFRCFLVVFCCAIKVGMFVLGADVTIT